MSHFLSLVKPDSITMLKGTIVVTALKNAIESREMVRLHYDPGERIVEPHALGYGKDGQLLLRAFQVSGASHSGDTSNWKLFRLDRMASASGSGQSFSGPRDDYRQNDSAMKGGIIAQL
ncbi:WYL domain-containing protein [Hoeflea sp.]|uniref:WYL domain-containing protein n=1 Tax=Hoeflea sp. TaxID=1940281 RepID=UPI003A8E7BF6